VVAEVLSSLEKAILAGNTEDAFYWTMEYVMMGDQFFVPIWSYLFQLAANSIGPADPATLIYLRTQYETDKGYRNLPATTSGGEEDEEEAADSGDVESTIDPNRLMALLETVRRLCLAPKTRTIDSIIRTFLMPYPVNTVDRPYEPYRSRLHLMSGDGGDLTKIPSLSYIDEYEEGKEPRYTLFQLQSSDPPYLAPWANALVHLFQQITTFNFDLSSESAAAQAREEFNSLERGAFYYAGLIYQCAEPCPFNKKLNSTYILWEIIHRFKVERVSNLIGTLREISDEITKHDNRRERPFLAMALLLTIRPWSIDLDDRFVSDEKIDLAALFEQNANEILEVNPNAIDYTTPEGKYLKRTVSDYLLTVKSIINQGSQNSQFADLYADMAYQLEVAREKAQMKDQKKNISYQIPFFSFNPDTVIPEHPDETTKKNRRKPKTAAGYKLDAYYTLPLKSFEEKTEGTILPWRGQFVPYMVRDGLFSDPHPFVSCFTNVEPVAGNKFKEGLFMATYQHPFLDQPPCDVFFIPCTGGPKQALNQCLLDELKPIFGIPAL